MANEAVEKPQLMPWQENYELKEVQAIKPAMAKAQEAPSQPVGAVEVKKMPWEMDWGLRPRPSLPSRSKESLPTNAANIDSYLAKTIGVESGGNPNAKNPESTATGLGQFIESTWQEQVALSGKNYTLADRKDPAKAKEILTDFTKRNMTQAKADLGRAPAEHELYLYHFLGSGDAGNFIKAPKDAPATEYVAKSSALANRTIFYKNGKPKTVGEVINQFKEKF